jgi:hypothetical protein
MTLVCQLYYAILRLAMLQAFFSPCGVILRRFFATLPTAEINDSIKDFNKPIQEFQLQLLEIKECLFPST